MRSWLAISALALVATWAVARAEPGRAPESRAQGLLDAFFADDRPTVDRLGQARGARGLAPDLVSPHRGTVLAAIAAAPAADDAWALLGPLARRAADPDRSLATRAAAAGARIAATLSRDLLLEHEAAPDELRDVLAAWLRVALDDGRWADVRVHALEVSAALVAALGPDGPVLDWAGMAADADPEVRRAALELAPVPPGEELSAEAGRRVADDENKMVALAAGQVLCGELATGAKKKPILDALGQEGIARLQDLVTDEALSAAARLEAARCLAVHGGPQSRAAVARFARSAPRHLRDQAAALARRR